METQIKSIIHSRTFWIAIIQGVIGVVVVFQTGLPELGWIAIVKSFLDVGLRYVTTTPVK